MSSIYKFQEPKLSPSSLTLKIRHTLITYFLKSMESFSLEEEQPSILPTLGLKMQITSSNTPCNKIKKVILSQFGEHAWDGNY
jgi:hypothetical protein